MRIVIAAVLALSLSTAQAGFFDSIGDAFSKTGIFHKQGNGHDRHEFMYIDQVPPGTEIIDPTTPVPLPPAIWLFLVGLAGLIGIARRKK